MDLAILILTLAMAIVPLIKDPINRDEKPSVNLFKKLHWSGFILLLSALSLIVLTYWKGKIDADTELASAIKSDNRHTQDSTRISKMQIKLDALGYTITTNDEIIKKGVLSLDEKGGKSADPVLDLVVFDNKSNPRLESTSRKDSVSYYFEFTVLNNSIAYNIRDKILLFNIRNNAIKPIPNGQNNTAITEDLKLYYNVYRGLIGGLILEKYPNFQDTLYFYVKVNYTNKMVKGEEQPPLRRIYFLVSKPNAKVRSDISDFKEPEDSRNYDRVKSMLMKGKYW